MKRAITRNNASLGWLGQAISGLLLIVFLSLHMIANHFILPGGLQTYQDVINYLSNPWIVVLEIFFLIFVTVHALLGVRAIVFDTGLSERAEQSVNRFLTILGILMVGYGFLLTFLLVNR